MPIKRKEWAWQRWANGDADPCKRLPKSYYGHAGASVCDLSISCKRLPNSYYTHVTFCNKITECHVNGFRMATMRTTATWRARRQGEGNRMCAGGCATLTGRLSLPCPLPYYIYRLRNRDCPAPRCRGKGQARSGQCLDS